MKKISLFIIFAIVFVAIAAAQDSYQVSYFSNRNNLAGADQETYIINPGIAGVGTPISDNEGTICANVYVFDAKQEMEECCSCPISANGLQQLSMLLDLTQSPLTGSAPDSGVIKIVSSAARVRSCPAGTETNPNVIPGLLAWQTHLQKQASGALLLTEDGFKSATLSTSGSTVVDNELVFLGQTCAFVQYLGSGKGQCTCGAYTT